MEINPRSAWGARPPRRRLTLATPTPRLWLHHLATDAWHGAHGMRLCQNFHMDSRGWDDIAYSFLIDEDGTVYEGRGAGVIGGHTAGDNSRSHAICVMGNFQDRAPSDVVLARVAELVRYGHEQGWWPSQLTGGHRDARPYSSLNATACPGEQMYALIAHINALAVGAAPAPVEPAPTPQPSPSPAPAPAPTPGGDDVRVPTLTEGAQGPIVGAMQQLLKYKGGNQELKVDNDFGPITAAWLADFQAYYRVPNSVRANGTGDAICGTATWQYLVDV